jgi:hypothetical protein
MNHKATFLTLSIYLYKFISVDLIDTYFLTLSIYLYKFISTHMIFWNLYFWL